MRARVVLAAAVALVSLWIGSAFVPAILWAAVVGIAVEPLRLRLLRLLPGRHALIAGLITFAVVAIVVIPLVIAITRAVAEVDGVAGWINGARAHGVPVAAWVANLPIGSTQLSAWWTSHLSTPEDAAEQIARLDMGTVIQRSKSVGHNVVERAMVFAFTVLMLFFIVRDHDAIGAQLTRAIDRAFGAAGLRIGHQITLSVRGTVDGVVLLGLAQGVFMATMYAIVGVPHPILLGLLSGVGAMLPSMTMRIDGPGYALTVVFGPFNATEAEPGFRADGSRTIDGVRLSGRRWTGKGATPRDGTRLWSASVGGGTRANLTYSAWGLRMQGRCADRRGCEALERLVGSIRF